MRIHPVVSVAQLKPTKGPDPYNRPRLDHHGPVGIEDMTDSTAAGKTKANKQYKVK